MGLSIEYIIDGPTKDNDESTFVCPTCHGEVEYRMENDRDENSPFIWGCNSCPSVYEAYELHLRIRK